MIKWLKQASGRFLVTAILAVAVGRPALAIVQNPSYRPAGSGGDVQYKSTSTTKFSAESSFNYQPSSNTLRVDKIQFADGTVQSSSATAGSGGGVTVYPASSTASFPYGLSGSTAVIPSILGDTTITGAVVIDNGGVNTLTVTGTGTTFAGATPISLRIENANDWPYNAVYVDFRSKDSGGSLISNGMFSSGPDNNYFYSADLSEYSGFSFGGTGAKVKVGDSGIQSDGSGNLRIEQAGTAKRLDASNFQVESILSATSLATDSSGNLQVGNAGILNATQTWSGGNMFTSHSTFTATLTIPQGTSPVLPSTGAIALDTTDGVLLLKDETNTTRVFGDDVHSFSISVSSGLGFVSTTTIPLGQLCYNMACTIFQVDAQTWSTSASTMTFQIEERTFGSSVNSGDTFISSVSATTTGISTTSFNNAGIAARANLVLRIGVITGAPDYFTMTVWYRKDPE